MVQLLVNGVTGGTTGYLTNAVALKMLFKSYFGVGGVIPKEYKTFSSRLGELIENYLITGRALKPALHSLQFQQTVQELVEKWFSEVLIEELEGVKIGEIPGIDQLLEETIRWLRFHQEELLFPFLDWYFNKPVSLFCPYDHFLYFKERWEGLVRERWREILIRTGVEKWELGELLGEQFWQKMEEELNRAITSKPTPQLLDQLRNLFIPPIERFTVELERELMKTPLWKLIPASPSNLSLSLAEEIELFLLTPNGEELLEELCRLLLQELKRIDKSIGELIGAENLERLRRWLETKFPLLIDEIIAELERDQPQLEEQIDEDIQRFLDKSVWGSLLRQAFMENLAKRYQIVGKIIQRVREQGERAPQLISQEIGKWLEQKSIGEIIGYLEEERLVTPEGLRKIFLQNIILFLRRERRWIEEELGRLLHRQLGDLGVGSLRWIRERLEERFPFLFLHYLQQELQRREGRLMEELSKKPVGEYLKLLPPRSISLAPLEQIYRRTAPKPVNRYLSPSRVAGVPLPWEYPIGKIADVRLLSLINPLPAPSHYPQITQFLIGQVEGRLEELLKGRVSQIVQLELEQFSPEQIGELAYDFFGREMIRINLAGGVIGAGVGALFGTLLPTIPPNLAGILTPIVYGLTGIGTNYLAIQLLFRPYQEKWYLLGLSPGAIIRNRERLARHIGKFVSERLLTDGAITRQFHQMEKQLAVGIIKQIEGEGFETLRVRLAREGINRVPELQKRIVQLVTKGSRELGEEIALRVERRWPELVPKLLPFLELKLTELLNEPTIGSGIGSRIREIFEEVSVDGILEGVKGELIKGVEEFIAQLRGELVETLEKQLELWGWELELVERRSLMELGLISPAQLEEWSRDLGTRLVEKLKKNRELSRAIYQKIVEELKGGKGGSQLGELFNGALSRGMSLELDLVLEEVIRVIREMEEQIVEDTLENLNWTIRTLAKGEVEGAIRVVLRRTLPKYIREKKEFLFSVIERHLLSQPASDLNLKLEWERFNQIWEEFWDREVVREGIFLGIKRILVYFANLPLKRLLEIGGYSSLEEGARELLKEWKPLLEKWLREEEEELQRLIQEGILEVIREELEGRQLGEFLEGLNWDKLGRSILKEIQLQWDRGLRKEVREIVWEILAEVPPNRKLFAKNLQQLLERIEEANREVGNQVAPILSRGVHELAHRIPNETLRWGIELG
ncbi:MAG: DUF445 family protein, partial [Campylobacterales bacterium]